MDFIDLKNKSDKELNELLLERKHELRDLRFRVSEKQLKNLSALKKARCVVARILTILNSRKTAGAAER